MSGIRIRTQRAIVVAGMCIGCAAASTRAAERMLPRTIDRSTTLVERGHSEAVIVYPSVEEGPAIGEAVQKAIADVTGVTLKLAADRELIDRVPAWPHERLRLHPLIIIGNISINRAIVPLYGNLLAGADVKYPGGDGYTLRTVVDPYGTEANEILLGASSTAGITRAVRAFAAIVNKHGKQGALTVPGLLEVVPGGGYVEIVAKAPASPMNYYWTGKPSFLRTSVQELRAAQYMKSETKSYNPSHYGKESGARELIALIQSGALKPEEVNHIENILLNPDYSPTA